MFNTVDISEDYLAGLGHGILEELLKDHTTGKNIIWATNDYAHLGEGYTFFDEITVEKITGEHNQLVKPRVAKEKDNQRNRSKDMAEVFTPSWVCNAQNNLVDEAWFGRKDVFNIENNDTNSWESTKSPIIFPEGKTWKDYVNANRLEMACGEAPYLVSRYDTVSGEMISLRERIGLLDRKLRVVSENANEEKKDKTAGWRRWTIKAYQSTYGFEWQGDNLLLARESMLATYCDYYIDRWGRKPNVLALLKIVQIISWNIWQMDGLLYGIPGYTPIDNSQKMFFENEENPNLRFCRIAEWVDCDPIKLKEVVFKQMLNKK